MARVSRQPHEYSQAGWAAEQKQGETESGTVVRVDIERKAERLKHDETNEKGRQLHAVARRTLLQERRHSAAQLSKKLLSFRLRLGCFSFRSALASI